MSVFLRFFCVFAQKRGNPIKKITSSPITNHNSFTFAPYYNNQIFISMEKTKLLEMRKSKGFSQQYMAEKLNMDVSTYHRRENGQVNIHISEWEKLAKILNVPLSEIYESDEKQVFICNDNTSQNFLGTNNSTNNIYTVPEALLKTQEKYIAKLEEENKELKRLLEKK
jgi:transcriptional regulator with XRE-family HTH domain